MIYEIIKDINDLEINREGDIRRVDNKKSLKYTVSSKGYFTVAFKKKIYKVHILVAKTFIENPDNKPIVNHIDTNKQNNHVSNLEWMTHSENTKHGYISHSSKKREIIRICPDTSKILETYDSGYKVEPEFKRRAVIDVCNNRVKTHRGYIFQYK